MSLHSLDGGVNRSRSVSPANCRNNALTRTRSRSPSPSRRAIKTSQSVDFERRGRSPSPRRRSNIRSSTTRINDYHHKDDGKSFFLSLSLFF